MKILFLGPPCPQITDFLKAEGHTLTEIDFPINQVHVAGRHFVISFGYRHIIKADVLRLLKKGRAINLHISYLPWNRGADPNLWSWVDKTPKGITIHEIDAGIDTGDIIYQSTVTFDPKKRLTLQDTYTYLKAAIIEMFCDVWPALRAGKIKATPQLGYGSFHTSKDRERIELPKGWNTPVGEL